MTRWAFVRRPVFIFVLHALQSPELRTTFRHSLTSPGPEGQKVGFDTRAALNTAAPDPCVLDRPQPLSPKTLLTCAVGNFATWASPALAVSWEWAASSPLGKAKAKSPKEPSSIDPCHQRPPSCPAIDLWPDLFWYLLVHRSTRFFPLAGIAMSERLDFELSYLETRTLMTRSSVVVILTKTNLTPQFSSGRTLRKDIEFEMSAHRSVKANQTSPSHEKASST